MDHLEIISQLDNIGVEVAVATHRVKKEYDRWSVGMSSETKEYLLDRLNEIIAHCNNLRELIR